MYSAIKEIQAEFQKHGLKYGVEQKENHWILETVMTGNNGTYHFHFVKKNETGNDVSVWIRSLVKVPDEKREIVYELLNSFQQRYRFIRFVLRGDGNVKVDYDFPSAYEPIGEGAVEILVRFTQILDECYPELMRAIWG